MPVDEATQLIGKSDRLSTEKTHWSSSLHQVVISGTGFLADAYDLFVIDLVLAILQRLHPDGIGISDKSLVASATLIGAVTGQVLFGVLGDWLGRKWTFLVTCFLIVFGALGSACVVWTNAPISLVLQLSICRFLLGIGVGGEYPLAATIAAENSDHATRGRLLASVFSMQGWGMLLSCALTLLFLLAEMPLEVIWRLLLALGALPSALVIYMRAKMAESALFEQAQEKHNGPSLREKAAHSFKVLLAHWHPMIGTTMTWLILDITFYGTGSFKSSISGFLIESTAQTPREEIWHEAKLSMYVVCMAIPGYLLSICFIDQIGRYKLQLGGFLAMSINFFLAAYLQGVLIGRMRWLLIVFFGLTFLFSNFGPNTTTFVIPVEIYPTDIRATGHGLSAAAGKIGAVIGAAAFAPVEHAYGIEVVLMSCGVVTIIGAIFTFFFTTDNVVDLVELDKAVPKTFA